MFAFHKRCFSAAVLEAICDQWSTETWIVLQAGRIIAQLLVSGGMIVFQAAVKAYQQALISTLPLCRVNHECTIDLSLKSASS